MPHLEVDANREFYSTGLACALRGAKSSVRCGFSGAELVLMFMSSRAIISLLICPDRVYRSSAYTCSRRSRSLLFLVTGSNSTQRAAEE
jgi:hypothetical protein